MDTRSFQEQLAHLWRTRPVRLPRQGHIAGVCSGIGVRYGVDPVLIRVAFVVSALFGGAGLVLYLAAWVLFTRHGDEVSALESLVGRGASSESTTKVVVILVALAIAAGAIGPVGTSSGGSGFIGTVLMLGGWWLLYQRRPEPPVLPAPEGPDRSQQAFPQPPVTYPYQYPWSAPAGTYTDAYTRPPVPPVAENPTAAPESPAQNPAPATGAFAKPDLRKDTAVPAQNDTAAPLQNVPAPPLLGSEIPTPELRTPPAWDPLGVAPFAWDLPDPTSTHEPAPTENKRSRLTTTMLGLAVIAAAVTAAIGAAGDLAWVTPARVGAVALAVIGLGLLIGAFLHRGYGLLVVTGPLLGFVVLASFVGPVDPANWGNRVWAPTTTDELQSEYRSEFGAMTLDLRDLDLTEDRTVQVDGRFGRVDVILPENLDVRATCTVDPGELRRCPAPGLNGGRDGEGGPVLNLDANMEFGTLEVRRG